MIEQDVYMYLRSDTTLSGLLGGNEKIYLVQVPSDPEPKMPWVVLEVTSGSRTQVSQSKMEEISYLRVSVDTGPYQAMLGRSIIERCRVLLENYRGLLTTATDVYVSVGAVRGWAGFSGVNRYQFDATIRFTEAYTQPVV